MHITLELTSVWGCGLSARLVYEWPDSVSLFNKISRLVVS